MDLKTRYLCEPVIKDLEEKMVFLGGPRQVGKTILARDLIGRRFESSYFNYDKIQQRLAALNGEWPSNTKLILLDEFHKYSKWKSWIKGEFDTQLGRYNFLLTGSARLDIYRRGGDSLQGRFHYYRLHPFSYAEVENIQLKNDPGEPLNFLSQYNKNIIDLLYYYGGFPEPFLKQNERFLRRWQNDSIERFIKDDLRELTQLRDFGTIALFSELLPERVGSILSINSLARDLQINYRTAANWLNTFDLFYYSFRLSPYQSRKIASVRKEKKLYLWNWSSIPDEGSKFENLIASHLLKFCHYLHDYEGHHAELYYLRDNTGREVDFLVSFNSKPWFAVEVKTKDTNISKALTYFKAKLDIPNNYQVVRTTGKDFMKDGIRVMPAAKFLSGLI